MHLGELSFSEDSVTLWLHAGLRSLRKSPEGTVTLSLLLVVACVCVQVIVHADGELNVQAVASAPGSAAFRQPVSQGEMGVQFQMKGGVSSA